MKGLYFFLPVTIIALILIIRGTAFPEEKEKTMSYINFNPQEESRYFLYPLTYYFNTAFDCSQVPDAFPEHDYFHNHTHVFNRISNPVKSINDDGGWGKFFYDEVGSERAVPNYTLHLLGGGYDCRTLWEWYHYNGFPAPYLFAFLTTYLAHFGNEAIEYNNRYLSSHDHIADLYIFDLAGNLLFLSDDVARFFHDTLQMRNWTGQPVISLSDYNIKNAFTSYVFRPYLFGETVRPFLYFGMSYMLGLSLRVDENNSFTMGAGIAVTKAFDADNDTFHEYMRKIRVTGAVFWDKNDALLWSLMINGTEHYRLRLNMYPELFRTDYFNFGVYVALDDRNRFVFGISVYKVFGIGATL